MKKILNIIFTALVIFSVITLNGSTFIRAESKSKTGDTQPIVKIKPRINNTFIEDLEKYCKLRAEEHPGNPDYDYINCLGGASNLILGFYYKSEDASLTLPKEVYQTLPKGSSYNFDDSNYVSDNPLLYGDAFMPVEEEPYDGYNQAFRDVDISLSNAYISSIGLYSLTYDVSNNEPSYEKVSGGFIVKTLGDSKFLYIDSLENKDELTFGERTNFTGNGITLDMTPTSTIVVTNDGAWVFTGYDTSNFANDEMIFGYGDNKTDGFRIFDKIIGYWKLVKEAYNANYKFVSENNSLTLPQEVLDLLPNDSTKYYMTQTATAITPTTTTVTVSDGVWTFVDYDNDSLTFSDSDVTFTGTWRFTKKTIPSVDPVKAKYKIDYKFVSQDSSLSLPNEVTKLLPSSVDVTEGTEYTSVKPTITKITVSDGVWEFVSYDIDSKTINENTTITGTWMFTKKSTVIPSEDKKEESKKEETKPSDSKVVTCEDINGKGWTWSESQGKCIYKVVNTSTKRK